MKKLMLVMASVIWLMAYGDTQADKNARIKEIRTAYAQAKRKIDMNGKNGKSPKDMNITKNHLIDEEICIYDMESLDYYFDESKTDKGDLVKRPYFIIEKWSNHGHERYREVLLNPKDRQVMFCYMRGVTDARFVVESRYYFDADGQCIETKHNTPNTWSSGETELDNAQYYLRLFDLANYNGYFTPLDLDIPKKPTTPKASRMQHIRSVYAQAKDKISKNDKNEDMPDEMVMTTHDMGDDMPPRTTVTKYSFDNDGCYFISQHITSMMYDGYSEYLFEPKTTDLIFSYSRGKEEGQTFEWRYYYDENGDCIETKSNSDETDGGFYDKRAATDFQAIFAVMDGE